MLKNLTVLSSTHLLRSYQKGAGNNNRCSYTGNVKPRLHGHAIFACVIGFE